MSIKVPNTPENKLKTQYTWLDNNLGTTNKTYCFQLIDHRFIRIPRVFSEEPLVFPEFSSVESSKVITLRENQKSTGERFQEIFKRNSFDGILVRDTAFGKTIMALYFFTLYKKKTLVIVNRVELMKQWETKIKKFLDVKVGRIQGNVYDVQDKDIVLATVQTLTVSKRSIDLSPFYCTFLDEIHLFSSEIFSKVLYKINSPFRIGLTATLHRKDNKQDLLKLHLPEVDGSEIVSEKKQSTNITIIPTKTVIKTITLFNGKINYSRMVTEITLDSNRNNIILGEIKKYIKHVSRKIIVMSDRLEQLRTLKDQLNHSSSQLFTGGNKTDFDVNVKITFATYQLAGVGFDLPELNTLIFASSRSDIKQIIGRIYRKTHLIQPVIVDFKDSHFVFIAQLNKRIFQYKTLIKNPILSNEMNVSEGPRFLEESEDE